MTWLVVLLGFLTLNAWAIFTGGWEGFVSFVTHLGPYGVLTCVDLMLALSVGIWWSWHDARTRGLSPWPQALLTLMTGSVGLLLYLVRHGTRPVGFVTRGPDGALTITQSRNLPFSVQQVWPVLADFHRVDRFHPYVHAVDAVGEARCGVGAKRRCHLRGVPAVEEEVTEWSEGHGYQVRGSTPFDFLGEVRGAMSVVERSAGCEARFELVFRPKLGVIGRVLGAFWVEELAAQMGAHILLGLEHHLHTGTKLSAGAARTTSLHPSPSPR